MNSIRHFVLTVVAVAALAACSSMPPGNPLLDQAHAEFREAQANAQTQALAPAELRQAGDALALADAAQARRDDTAQVSHLAYLARQQVALAQAAASRKGSEAAVAEASATRDQLRLAARTREADNATTRANIATRDAQSAERRSDAAQIQSATSQQQAAASREQAVASQQQASLSRQQADDADRRSRALETQLSDLNARKTDRGMVITIGDVLFDSGQSQLKSGGMRHIERLSGFLKEYPQRKAAIEGYTDSTGSESMNQALSSRRAEAVRSALVGMGVGSAQLAAQGYGDAHPVAGNESSGGRQANRRVEIVLSDENGVVIPR
jgi:outer membrane protein OmpA-like peptidoglycan-associated protein